MSRAKELLERFSKGNAVESSDEIGAYRATFFISNEDYDKISDVVFNEIKEGDGINVSIDIIADSELNTLSVLEDYLGEYEIEVVDVLQHPQLAEEGRILATPTVVRQLPEPVKYIIGDLSHREKILVGLDLQTLS